MLAGMSPRALDRRRFLKATAASAATAALAASPASLALGSPAGRRFAWVHLDGGNDPWNTVVPLEDDEYHRVRGRLAIRAADALRLDGVGGAVGGAVGLHPSLGALRRRFDRGEVAIVRGVFGAAARGHLAAADDARTWLDGSRARIERIEGFDTHARQAPRHADRLALLDATVAGAAEDLVVVTSEFGRTFAANSFGGTEHADSSLAFVIGRSVRGGLHGDVKEPRAARILSDLVRVRA